jgi:hypothetical protein
MRIQRNEVAARLTNFASSMIPKTDIEFEFSLAKTLDGRYVVSIAGNERDLVLARIHEVERVGRNVGRDVSVDFLLLAGESAPIVHDNFESMLLRCIPKRIVRRRTGTVQDRAANIGRVSACSLEEASEIDSPGVVTNLVLLRGPDVRREAAQPQRRASLRSKRLSCQRKGSSPFLPLIVDCLCYDDVQRTQQPLEHRPGIRDDIVVGEDLESWLAFLHRDDFSSVVV